MTSNYAFDQNYSDDEDYDGREPYNGKDIGEKFHNIYKIDFKNQQFCLVY